MELGLTARPPFPWVGGKERLQYIIRSIFPPRPPRFVEHFGGSGSILLGQPMCLGRMDVYNDYDSDLTNLFLCIRDRTIELLNELGFFPLHSEEEFLILLKILRRETILPDFTESELTVAKAVLTGIQYEQVEKILRGRASAWDVKRAAAFYTVDRRSFNSMRQTFALRPTNIRSFFKLITAAALMRPSRSVMDIEVKSVKKKFKDKRFAAGVNREVILQGVERLGMDLDTVITETIKGMQKVAEAIGLGLQE